jgi:hypothetical protein
MNGQEVALLLNQAILFFSWLSTPPVYSSCTLCRISPRLQAGFYKPDNQARTLDEGTTPIRNYNASGESYFPQIGADCECDPRPSQNEK